LIPKVTEQKKNSSKKDFYFLCKMKRNSKFLDLQHGILFLHKIILLLPTTHTITSSSFSDKFKFKFPLCSSFLQKGFAVAFGGRGGLDAHTISRWDYFFKVWFANYSNY
jgi:hypothetical protein